MNNFTQNTLTQEQAIKIFLRDYLNNSKNDFGDVLAGAGEYYDADRSYIFELNETRTEISNTYEWCRGGIPAEIDNLQNITADGLECWFKTLEEKGEFFISSASENFAEEKMYKILERQHAVSLAVAPLIVNGSVFGFLGVNNPRRNTGHLLLLSVIASVCCNRISVEYPMNSIKETNKNLQETNSELTELLKAEKLSTAIIDSLSSIFFALYYIDIEKDSFREIFSLDSKHHTYKEKKNVKSFLKNTTENLVKEEYKSAMRIFTDIETIDERLGDKTIITQDYIDFKEEWIRCVFIPVEKNNNGRNIKIICGFRNNTKEKETMEVQNNLIQALSMSYENVYAVNMDTTEAICYRMGQAIIDRYGQKFASGDYDLNIRLYIENDVFEDDRHLFDKICSVSNVKKLLADKHTYSFVYRVFRNNLIQYFECQIVKPNSKRNEFVAGFKNVDEEKKQELAQQKKIEDALAAVKKINETLRDEMEIAGALSKEYPNVVLLDFENDTVTTIKQEGNIIAKDKRVSHDSYNDRWNYYISKYVLDEDKTKLKAAVSADAVQQALENSDEYICTYRTVYDDTGVHHYQAAFIRIYSRCKTEGQIILGFRNIDAIVEEERKHIKIQEEQLRIIGALSQEYHSLFKIDAATGKLSLYRTDGIGIAPE